MRNLHIGLPRLLCQAALAGLLLCTAAQPLRAEGDVPPTVRDEVELLWLEGHVEAIDELLADYQDGGFAGRWPLLLRDRYWRAGSLSSDDAGDAGLSGDGLSVGERTRHAAALAWLRAVAPTAPSSTATPGPVPAWDGGGDAPYPILRALVEDRERRELHGYAGLPAGSPLLLLAERLMAAGETARAEALTYYTRPAMERVYTGEYEFDPSYAEADRQAEARAIALEERNGAWALWSLLAFILVPLALGLRLLGRRT